MKEKKVSIIPIIVALALLIILGGYLIFKKTSKKEPIEIDAPEIEKPFEPVNIELTDPLLKTLVYPKVNGLGKGGALLARYIYKNITLDIYDRDYMMISSAQGITKEAIENSGGYKYNASLIKNNFISIFGPDIEYKDGDLSGNYCCQIQTFNEINNTYISNCRCGGDGPDFDNYTKLYKAVQNEDNIETYFYVQPYVEWQEENKYYLYDRELEYNEFVEDTLEPGPDAYKIINYTKVVSNINEIDAMMNRGEVDTYIFTFKKQSDGNYYFYSGAWSN